MRDEITDLLRNFAALRADIPLLKANATPFNSALKAARTLQELLPVMIARHAMYAADPPLLLAATNGEHTTRVINLIAVHDLSKLQKALANCFPADIPVVSVNDWIDDFHLYAHLLFVAIARMTGLQQRTRKGAPAKFISAALRKIGYANATEGAVDQALSKPPRKYADLAKLIRRNGK